MDTVLVLMWGIMPDFLLRMLAMIPTKQHPAMSRERAIVLGLSQTMSCAEVIEENWINRVYNIMNESADFAFKMRQEVVQHCYDKVDQVCDFKGLEVIKARWVPGRAGVAPSRQGHLPPVHLTIVSHMA